MKSLRELVFGKKYFVAFLMKENGTYTLLHKKRIKKGTESITYKGKTYPLLVESPTYTNLREVIYMVDISNGQKQLVFNTNKGVFKEQFEALNDITKKKIINDLTTNLVEKPSLSEKIMLIACGLGIGLFIGFLVAQLLFGGA